VRPGTLRRRWAAVAEEGGELFVGVDLDPLGSSEEEEGSFDLHHLFFSLVNL
jgi:hypothetical protein